MADYVPFSSAGLPTRPVDMVSGFDAGLADQQQRKAQAQSLEQMMIANAQKKAELERYQGMTPNELAESDWKGTMARNRTGNAQLQSALLQGEIGDATSKAVKGRLDAGTEETTLAATNAANRGKVDAEKLAGMQRGLDFMNVQEPMLKAAANAGPMAAQMYWQQLHGNLPDNIKQVLPAQWTPDLLPKLELMRQRMVRTIEAQRKVWEEEQKQKATGAWHERVANITGGYHLAAANVNAAAKKKDTITSIRENLMKQRAGSGWATQAYAAFKDDADVPEALRNALKQAAIEDDNVITANRGVKAPPGLPGFPTPPNPHSPALGSGVAGNRVIDFGSLPSK